MGVVVTHVAFQTGHSSGVAGRLFGRFDLAVAVFFALSGFLLWRGHAAAARDKSPRPATGHYLRSRVVRIMPALSHSGRGDPDPVARRRSRQPDGVAGKPDAHPDLCAAHPDRRTDPDVEPVRRGHLLPGAADPGAAGPPPPGESAGAGDRRLGRAQLGLGLGAHSITQSGINPLNWPPAFFSWFAAGMLLAEWVHSPIGLPHRLARSRVLMAVRGGAGLPGGGLPAGRPGGAGPRAATAQFAVKAAMGAVVALALVAPLVLDRPARPTGCWAAPPW